MATSHGFSYVVKKDLFSIIDLEWVANMFFIWYHYIWWTAHTEWGNNMPRRSFNIYPQNRWPHRQNLKTQALPCHGNCENGNACCCSHVNTGFGVYPDGTTYSSGGCRSECRWLNQRNELNQLSANMTGMSSIRKKWYLDRRHQMCDDYLFARGFERLWTPKSSDKYPVGHRARIRNMVTE